MVSQFKSFKRKVATLHSNNCCAAHRQQSKVVFRSAKAPRPVLLDPQLDGMQRPIQRRGAAKQKARSSTVQSLMLGDEEKLDACRQIAGGGRQWRDTFL